MVLVPSEFEEASGILDDAAPAAALAAEILTASTLGEAGEGTGGGLTPSTTW